MKILWEILLWIVYRNCGHEALYTVSLLELWFKAGMKEQGIKISDLNIAYEIGNRYQGLYHFTKDGVEYIEEFRILYDGINLEVVSLNCYPVGTASDNGNTDDDFQDNSEEGFIRRAENGDVDAMYTLGLGYFRGEEVEQNYYKAVKWFMRAAEQGKAEAQYFLGVCYEKGDGITKDLEESFGWYKKAAEQGDEDAIFAVGNCYLKGDGVTENDAEAFKWFSKGTQKNHAASQWALGLCYENGWGTSINIRKAVSLFYKAAEQGDEDAQKELNDTLTKYLKAAQTGEAKSEHTYGRLLEATERPNEAIKWFRKAAEQNYPQAQMAIGRFYVEGKVVEKDPEKAVEWFSKAAELGLSSAQGMLAKCYTEGFGVPQDNNKAVLWCRKAAEQGDMHSQYLLACLLSKQGNDLESIHWMKKAAEQEQDEALLALGVSYFKGLDENNETIKDLQAAHKYISRSAELGNAVAKAIVDGNELAIKELCQTEQERNEILEMFGNENKKTSVSVSQATVEPTPLPKMEPQPKAEPTPQPKVGPTPQPKAEPTPQPKVGPTPQPRVEPTPQPKAEPTPQPKTEPTPQPKVEPTPQPIPQPKAEPTPQPQPKAEPKTAVKGKGKKTWIVALVVSLLVLALCGGIGGYFYYENVYLPEKIDREAPRYYTFGNVVLRSSREVGVDFNKVASLPYGSELITYEHGSEWSRVKVSSSVPDAPVLQGYVASPYILSKREFALLNSIWGDTESKEAILTSKCRIALLNYYKQKGYTGRLSAEAKQAAGMGNLKAEQWQVFVRSATVKPNELFFKRLVNKDSKFTDFAVIIKNIETGDRRLLYFYFDDDETPHLLSEQDAPREGMIEKITMEYGSPQVTFTTE